MNASYEGVRRHTDLVRQAARGRWDILLARLVPEIAKALERPGRHVTCPFHGGKGDFRVTKDYAIHGRCICTCGNWDGFDMLRHARSWSFPEAVQAVEDVLGCVARDIEVRPPVRPTPRQSQADAQQIQARIQKYWVQALDLDDPAAGIGMAYWASRGLDLVTGIRDVRFHPSLPYCEEAEDGTQTFSEHPALVAVVRRPDGRVATMHRTWLKPTQEGGWAVLERKLYAAVEECPVMGGAIRLFDANGPVLNLAEGIETSLSARAIAPDLPVWSCVNKEMLRAVQLPDHVRVVTVFADRDRSCGGQEAAIELVDRLRAEGRRAMMFLPNRDIPEGAKGIDWNDVIRRYGPAATQQHLAIKRWRRQIEEVRQQMAHQAA